MEKKIEAICLSAAAGCSLHCEYCVIEKYSNFNHQKEVFENTIKALEDGTYLKNTLIALEKIKNSRYDINAFSIWGQEPTLILDYITQNWEEWYNSFPNINEISFSTNGMQKMDSILNFLIKIDDFANKTINITIQFSYDGHNETNKIRKGSADTIKNNLIYLVNKINEINFLKIKIEFKLHGVLLASELKNKSSQDIIDMFNEYDLFFKQVLHLSNNKSLSWIQPDYTFALGKISATSEDGINAASFIKKIISLQKNDIKSTLLDQFNIHMLTGPICGKVFNGFKQYSKILLESSDYNDYILRIISYIKTEEFYHNFCSPGIKELKIMYDGTIHNCSNYIFDTNNFNDKQLTIEAKNIKYQLEHNHSVNLITASDEKIKEYFNFVETLNTGSAFFFNIHDICNKMIILSRVGQIDSSYKNNYDKMIRHAYYIANYNLCYYNLIVENGVNLTRSFSDIKLLCNGVLDILEQDFIHQFNLKKKELSYDR